MNNPLLDRLGNWNPQLVRELKGRFKVWQVAIAIALSLLFQLCFFLRIISTSPNTYPTERYCHLIPFVLPYLDYKANRKADYQQLRQQLTDYLASNRPNPLKVEQLQTQLNQLGSIIKGVCPKEAFDFQLWWQDFYAETFTWIAFFTVNLLLVAGAYMLIANLTQEERRGTLNFLRLSPQSVQSILGGKLLGVPSLLYLAVGLTLPFQFWVGIAAHLSPIEIADFWIAVLASCVFFYSGAVLFALVSAQLSGFQAWLGSGAVLVFLFLSHTIPRLAHSTDWLTLFSPNAVLPYLVGLANWEHLDVPFFYAEIKYLSWFHLPLGQAGVRLIIFMLLNFGLWTYWLWQALKRRFHHPNLAILSKQQSYVLSACFATVNLGFAFQSFNAGIELLAPLLSLLILNLLLFVGAIAILSPPRQTLQDWARYRQEKHARSNHFWPSGLLTDLLWGEKSPALLAIALNLAILALPILLWILLLPSSSDLSKGKTLLGLWLTLNLSLISALLVQLTLLMKTAKRAFWATAAGFAIIVLPPLIVSLLFWQSIENSAWPLLLTVFALGIVKNTTSTEIVFALLFQGIVLSLLTWQIAQHLQRLGESDSKSMFAEKT